MRIKCPCCYAEFDLVAALDSDAGREAAMLLASLHPDLARPLAAYIGLFRSPSRALAFDRVLRLAKEVLQLTADHNQLAAALVKSIDSLRQKQGPGMAWKPLSNHNYLKNVLSGIGAVGVTAAVPVVVQPHHAPRFTSQRGKMLEGLDAFAND